MAAAAEVSVTGNKVKVHRIVASTDPGYAVNPAQIERQIAGSFVYGLSALFYQECTVKDGAIEQTNFHEYKPIRLADVPPIDVELIPSGHHPSGVGEPASTVIAPAVANAVFNAVGARVRHMPISADAVLEAMKKKA